MSKKALLFLIPFMVSSICFFNQTDINEISADDNKMEISDIPVVTTSDFDDVKINGDSRIDEGIIYYRNYNNILHYDGYRMPDKYLNCLVEFNVYFEEYDDPNSYFSIEFRASDCGSVLADPYYVEQNGYCFVLKSNGQYQIYKDHNSTPIFYGLNGPTYSSSTTILFKTGVIEEEGKARLILVANNTVIYDNYDSVSPILSGGNYLNFCSWMNGIPLKATISPTKEVEPLKYRTYTLSTLNKFPILSGDIKFLDNYNNLDYSSAYDSAGFEIYEQNYSFELSVNFQSFPSSGTAFYVGMRCLKYGRADGSDMGGYSFGLGNGHLFLIKSGYPVLAYITFPPITENVDHILEFGTVDVNADTTFLFVKVDGNVIASYYDNDSPHQYRGMLLITNAGVIKAKLRSSDSYALPLQTKVESSTAHNIYTVCFKNSIAFESGLNYENIGDRNLKAVLVNNESILSLNGKYYGSTIQEKAVDIKMVSNKIIISVSKKMHKFSDDSEFEFDVEKIKITKTGDGVGLLPQTRYSLAVSYIKRF